MSTENIDKMRLKYIKQIQDLVRETKGSYYLRWSIPKEINNNFYVLKKLVNAMLKDKAEENPKEKGQPSNMHRHLAQCIIDEEYKYLTPEEREPDCYADIEFEDVLIMTKCWGFDIGNSTPMQEEDVPIASAIRSSYFSTFYSME
jgi:hypothetical protein